MIWVRLLPQKVSLTINARVHLNIGNADGEFATQLLNVGSGVLDQDSHNEIQLPFQTIQTEDEPINRVFTDFYSNILINGSVIEHF